MVESRCKKHFNIRIAFLIFIGVLASTYLEAYANTKGNSLELSTKSARPNIVLVLVDDLGFSDLGSYGGEINTPVLDKLAKHGLRYSQMYSTGRCWPSRASLMTGYYAPQVGMDPRDGKSSWPAWTRLLPHYLKDVGYRSYISGKWHLRESPVSPLEGGFDRSYHLQDHDRFFSPLQHELDNNPLPPVKRDEGYYATLAITDYAIDFLSQHQKHDSDKPFFLYMGYTAPHFPLHALPEDIEKYRDAYTQGWDKVREKRYKRAKKLGVYRGKLSSLMPEIHNHWSLNPQRLVDEIHPDEVGRAVSWSSLSAQQKHFQTQKMAVHAAMIDRLDSEVGRLMAHIEKIGKAENTLFFFLSDNGASSEQMHRGDRNVVGSEPGSADSYLGIGPGWSSAANSPLRLHKYWMHEGGIATPFIVHWPKGIKAHNKIRHVPAHIVDIVPTILEVSGASIEPEKPGPTAPAFPGMSLVPSFEQEPDWLDRTLFWDHSGHYAIRVGDWKAVSLNKGEIWELYNLKTDRAEQNNLAEKRPQLLAQLVARWQARRQQYRQIDYQSTASFVTIKRPRKKKNK